MIIDSHAVHTEKDPVDATGSKKVVKSMFDKRMPGEQFLFGSGSLKVEIETNKPLFEKNYGKET